MVSTTKVSSDLPKADRLVPWMASFKDARVAVEEGNCDTWGQLLEIPFKVDKYGLGFIIKAQKEVRRARAGKPPLRIGGHEFNPVGASDDKVAFEDWVYPTTTKLNNCQAKHFVSISFIKE